MNFGKFLLLLRWSVSLCFRGPWEAALGSEKGLISAHKNSLVLTEALGDLTHGNEREDGTSRICIYLFNLYPAPSQKQHVIGNTKLSPACLSSVHVFKCSSFIPISRKQWRHRRQARNQRTYHHVARAKWWQTSILEGPATLDNSTFLKSSPKIIEGLVKYSKNSV